MLLKIGIMMDIGRVSFERFIVFPIKKVSGEGIKNN